MRKEALAVDSLCWLLRQVVVNDKPMRYVSQRGSALDYLRELSSLQTEARSKRDL